MKRFATLLLLAWPVAAAPVVFETRCRVNVADLPASSAEHPGKTCVVLDGASASDCTVGGGSTVVLCVDKGAAGWAAVAASGSGTVTSLSVASANGVSATVANPTTTPSLTFTLGAITPSSVAATGTVTGLNLSGTNTGDQTSISGNAATATALAANPTDCTSGLYANGIAANGNLSCGQVDYSQISGAPAAGLAGSSGSIDRAVILADGTGGSTVQGSSNLFQDSSKNLYLADASGFRSFCFGTVDTVPCMRRSGTSLMLEGKGDGVPRELVLGWVSAFNTDTPSSFSGIQIRNGFRICFSNGTDYGRCLERADSILSITNGAGGFMGLKVGSVVFSPLSSPPYICDATREGATYYDSSDHDYCDCKGAPPSWTARGAGACS